MRRREALATVASVLALPTTRDNNTDAAAEVRAALTRFLTAFENLDWPTFRAAVEARFHEVFEAIRAGHPGGPPFHRLEPQELRIDALGPDAAIATFHLRSAERTARRTIVFRRTGTGWAIAHLHASNVAASPAP